MTGTAALVEITPPGLPSARAEIEDLPPSARTVYTVLETLGPLTHKGLLEATRLPGRTVRYAVNRLRARGVVAARANLHDCRQSYFFIQRGAPESLVNRAFRVL